MSIIIALAIYTALVATITSLLTVTLVGTTKPHNENPRADFFTFDEYALRIRSELATGSTPTIVSTQTHRDRCFTVLLDGEDVSDNCFFADSERGIVGSYLLESESPWSHLIINGEIAKTYRFGTVNIIEEHVANDTDVEWVTA